MEKARPVSLKEIRIRDNFWDKYRRLVREEILKYQWCAMNDQIEGAPKSHCIENFRIAAGEKQGEFYGAVFQDSDVAKWLEAVAYTLAEKPDKELKKLADSVIELIGRAQEPDGYFNTYFILKEPGQRFRNLREGHELYTLGHMIEAAVAYKRATGEKRFLEIVQKMADLVANTFGVEEGKRMGMPGHQEIELALMKLYEETGKESYKELAKYFIIITAIFMPQNAFLHASYFTLRSGGRTIITFLFDSVFIWVVSVSVAFTLSRFTALPVLAIYALVQAADFIKCIIGFILVKKGVWLRNIVTS